MTCAIASINMLNIINNLNIVNKFGINIPHPILFMVGFVPFCISILLLFIILGIHFIKTDCIEYKIIELEEKICGFICLTVVWFAMFLIISII